ncbi:hypothetical protein [Mucilaginibacter sp. UR6-11]|uniref:hypothetical protein n=1 Tax=Mucilaginibacter sp. UR6-11 TaxID=1435644 RepID=UPI001E601EF6|nr:hypothetical protein [Mucilaginibacter sp. UR6-11]MCC8427241.1 hypothetical protein [Mucilaginibacter sp. UR6-11]
MIKILTLTVLLLIFLQDILSRSVYWILFPILTALFIAIRLLLHQFGFDTWQAILINVAFLALQLLLVSAWFSFKHGKQINIMTDLLGWGDVLFLLATTFYLSVLNFLFFYITSLIAVIVLWFLWKGIGRKKNKHIPMAGFQAVFFMAFLTNDWWLMHLNIMNDDWLLHLIVK